MIEMDDTQRENLEDSQLPDDFPKRTWQKLEIAVVGIQECKGYEGTEDLYQDVATMLSRDDSYIIYNGLYEMTEIFMHGTIDEVIMKQTMSINKLMHKVNNMFTYYKYRMTMIRKFFDRLEYNTHTPKDPNRIPSMWESGPFPICFQLPIVVQTRIVEGILILIEQERNGDEIDRILLKSLLQVFFDLRIYYQPFEQAFLRSTERFYAAEGQRLMQELEVPQYLVHVNKRIEEENERIINFLHCTTKYFLISTVEKQLISQHINNILREGLDNILEGNRVDDLFLLYEIFSRVENGLHELCLAINKFIFEKGDIIKDVAKDKLVIQQLLDFKDNKPSEFTEISNSNLRAGNKETTEEELELFFKFIYGEEVFNGYKTKISTRFLVVESASTDAENNMFTKLKGECDDGSERSKDINVANVTTNKEMPLDVTGSMDRANGNWPTYTPKDVTKIKQTEMMKQLTSTRKL